MGDFRLQYLIGVAGDIFQNMLHPASQNAAEIVDGGGGDGLVFAELIDGGAGDMMIFDEGIGGFVGISDGLPEGSVRDQRATSLDFG